MPTLELVHVVDSHTEGEPTRVVVAGGPDLGGGSLQERLYRFQRQFDDFRAGLVSEPRGSDVIVGALLLEPIETGSTAGVIFFNDVGYLGMCGHGTIGVITTLAHLGRIAAGLHRLETPVGLVTARLHENGYVTVENIPSRRYRASVPVDVPGLGRLVGDVAWGGNWFFLVGEHPFRLESGRSAELVEATRRIRTALQEQGITGEHGRVIDHIELFTAPHDPRNSARNFVLCPGSSFDRSPCGTGTSAKMACLHADGLLAPGDVWRQEGILGTVFEGSIAIAAEGQVLPSIRARAWVTAQATLHFSADDPFANGIRF